VWVLTASHSGEFPMSSWARPSGEDVHFLAPGIWRATVTCEHWSTPERFVAPSRPLPR
jgi:hypothetical protein